MTNEKISRGMLTCNNNNIAGEGESDSQSPAKLELLSEMNKNTIKYPIQSSFMKKNSDSLMQSQTVNYINFIQQLCYIYVTRIRNILFIIDLI